MAPMPLALEPTVQSVGRLRFLVLRIASYISYRQSESSTLGRNFLGRRQAPATSTASDATHTERTTSVRTVRGRGGRVASGGGG